VALTETTTTVTPIFERKRGCPDKVLLASGSMTAAIDRLENRGLVVRKSTSSDRRTRIVELTQEGNRVAAAYFERHARDLEDLMSVLSPQEKRQVYASLKKLGLYAAQKLDGAPQPVQERQRGQQT
jgi:MarR family 2-MHQ and catechol resistance regulon transcriptional repressor